MKNRFVRAILFWGALWGIFESTVGTLLHLLPVNMGWLVWTPMAFSCMTGAYMATGKIRSVPYTACIASALKLTNLLTPMRADYAINPAVSILLEAGALCAALALWRGLPKRPIGRALAALFANTLWRGAYLLYLCFTPAWMREVSVLAERELLIRHMITENLVTSALIFILFCFLPAGNAKERKYSPILITCMCAANCALIWL